MSATTRMKKRVVIRMNNARTRNMFNKGDGFRRSIVEGEALKSGHLDEIVGEIRPLGKQYGDGPVCAVIYPHLPNLQNALRTASEYPITVPSGMRVLRLQCIVFWAQA
jgi:hypothetical protein